MKTEIAEQGDRKVVKADSQLKLLDGRYRFSAVSPLGEDSGHD